MALTAEQEDGYEPFTWGDDDWRTRAACRGVDTEKFFPTKGSRSSIGSAQARLICMTCPVDVRKACLNFALKNHIKYGVFGGFSSTGRRSFYGEEVTDRSVMFTLTNVYAILKRALDPAPIESLARLFNQSEEWVHTQMSNGADHLL